MGKDDIERELHKTPAVPMVTDRQKEYLVELLDYLDLSLDEATRDCYVNGDFESDPDEIGDMDDLSRIDASILIDYLKELRHEQ